MDDTRELLYALRGVPSRCDFCGREMPPAQLYPEEAGDWICAECLAKDAGDGP